QPAVSHFVIRRHCIKGESNTAWGKAAAGKLLTIRLKGNLSSVHWSSGFDIPTCPPTPLLVPTGTPGPTTAQPRSLTLSSLHLGEGPDLIAWTESRPATED
ncbi:hypothetical protein AAFF_G00419170, partial [Aldrovandia affinis]